MKKRTFRKAGVSYLGYLLFFVTIAVTVTCAVLIYDLVEEKSGGNRTWIAVIMFICILALASICTLIDVLRRRIMVERPVRMILDATEKIASGDFSVRLQPAHTFRKYDEYDFIMENLNTMAIELSKTQVLKSDFISNVSHELKTPLAVIQNYAAAIKSEKLPAETRRKYAETLAETSKKLSDLIGNILKLNKLENQEILSEIEVVDLGESLRQSVLQLDDSIERKNLDIRCDIDDLTIRSIPGYLEIVWNNLLSNAIKFTEEGGTVSVTLHEEKGRAVVKIADTGCGISSETGSHIFDKFYQGDTSHSQEGNGLGLALVRKVIDILGGEISVESAVGVGSTFTVKLRMND